MTEQDWLACDDPMLMLDHHQWVTGPWPNPFTSDRKLRLFACACCRQIWHLLTDERSRRAVEAAEQFADRPDFFSLELFDAGVNAPGNTSPSPSVLTQDLLAWGTTLKNYAIVRELIFWFNQSPEQALPGAHLLRDIVGNPFRPVVIKPLACSRDMLHRCVSLAQAIYDDRDFALMPILADALEEAGCQQEEILRHCREPGTHVRGCWCVDLLLGKV